MKNRYKSPFIPYRYINRKTTLTLENSLYTIGKAAVHTISHLCTQPEGAASPVTHNKTRVSLSLSLAFTDHRTRAVLSQFTPSTFSGSSTTSTQCFFALARYTAHVRHLACVLAYSSVGKTIPIPTPRAEKERETLRRARATQPNSTGRALRATTLFDEPYRFTIHTYIHTHILHTGSSCCYCCYYSLYSYIAVRELVRGLIIIIYNLCFCVYCVERYITLLSLQLYILFRRR